MIWPLSGVISPAIMLRMLLLPLPDGPNKAVTPAPLVNATAISASPSRFSTMTSKDMRAPTLPPHQPFGRDQRPERQQDRHDRQAHHRRLPVRHLQRGVDRDRQGPRLAGNVGDEADRRAKLADRTREAE